MQSVILTALVAMTTHAETRPRQYPSPQIEKFIELETTNSMIVKSEVDPKFRPAKGNIFELPFVDLPSDVLEIIDSGLGAKEARSQFLVEKNGKSYFRFFIHPESMGLYQPLIQKYGIDGQPTGHYLASPTASTRSLVAWDPKNPNAPPFIVKVSLAKEQDGFSRVVPGWEIRRSVLTTELVALTPEQEWLQNGTVIIPEFLGAYVKENLGLGVRIDDTQPMVLEHGLIARDLSFVERFETPTTEVLPMFALFTERARGPPLMVQWFKESGEENFEDYIRTKIIEPFIQSTGYLLFEQGIVPEMHSQNTLVVLDKKTHQLKTVLHRDVGSMKIDLRLRMIKGRSVAPLKSEKAALDFKFKRATESMDSALYDYFFGMTFSMDPAMGYGRGIKKYIPDYSSSKIRNWIQTLVKKQIQARLPLSNPEHPFTNIEEHLLDYFKENPPQSLKLRPLKENTALTTWLTQQRASKQFMTLPESWDHLMKASPGEILQSEYGIIVKMKTVSRLYFYDSEKTLKLFSGACSRVLRAEGEE